MVDTLEMRVWQKQQLSCLLRVKMSNAGEVAGLQDEIKNIVILMEQEDVAYVEKIVGVNAL